MRSIRRELTSLSQKTNLVMQWIPAHCDIKGNEEADRLSKEGSKATQEDHPISYSEAKTLLRNCFYSSWRARIGPRDKDETDHLTRRQQTIIFRLRTGHCRLLAHLNRIRIAHTNECPCGTKSQTPEHILQSCPIHDELRQATWPDGETYKRSSGERRSPCGDCRLHHRNKNRCIAWRNKEEEEVC